MFAGARSSHAREALACRSLDLLLPCFCALVLFLLLVSSGRVPGAGRAAGVWALLGVLAFLLGRLPRERPSLAVPVHVLGAVGVLVACYSALGLVLPWLLPAGREWTLLALDRRLLGYTWEGAWSGLEHPLLTDFLSVVYASFYLCPLVLVLALLRRRDWQGLYSGVDRVILGFLLSYCGYLLVPARSPWSFVAYEDALPSWGLEAWLHGHLIIRSPTAHDCFPSGHTMMSAYVAWLAWQRVRPLAFLLAPWALLTAVATLYLRYHYAVDLLAGALACVAWIAVADRVLGRWCPSPRPPGGGGS